MFVEARSKRRRRRWPWVLLAVVVLLVATAGTTIFTLPHGSLRINADGLPQVHAPRFSGRLVSISVRSSDGTPIPIDVSSDGTLRPTRPVVPGTHLVARAVFRRSALVGWLAGHTETVSLSVDAPSAQIGERWLRVKAGAPVQVSFDRPVLAVAVRTGGRTKTIHLPTPARTVSLGRFGDAGTVGVSAVPLGWERLPPPTSVTWFPPGTSPMLLASPKRGAELGPVTPLQLRFSDPVDRLLHGRMPTLDPSVPGTWRSTDTHTLEFTPRGYGFGLDGRVKLTLPTPVTLIGAPGPARTIAWMTPTASPLRLEQMLALLRYLPLRWTATRADAARTVAGQVDAAVAPPAGRFTWRYPNTPGELTKLWYPGRFNILDRGAVMAFQKEHDLTVDGFAGHDVWKALIADVIAGRPRGGGYSYVFVHSAVPTSLNLWHNGQVILTSPGNTGVPAAPTKLGTFPVFEHIPVGTMSGTNPDGSHYNDPGVRWISYFNHGEGIHAFNRASFGTPQSLGCVELPLAAAAKVWPYTPIGTLVTVET